MLVKIRDFINPRRDLKISRFFIHLEILVLDLSKTEDCPRKLPKPSRVKKV